MLCLLACITSAAACNKPPKVTDRTYDAAAVEQAARTLIEQSLLLCDIYYGAGIPAAEGEGVYTYGRYTEADPAYLSEHGISSIDALKRMTLAVFSEAHAEQLFATTFEVVKDDDVPVSVTRYYEQTAKEDRPYRFMVDTRATVYYKHAYTYDLTTLRATHAEGERVFVEVVVSVTDGEHTQTRTQSLALVEEEVGWRLDSMPGASYSPYFDRTDT